MEFRDRVANKPNRVRLTYEEGGASVYATVELADEPIDEGTPLNALNMNKLLNKENNDYIIEQGTSGGFTYEKWNSGTFKMWGKVTFSYDSKEYLISPQISYPVQLSEPPLFFFSYDNKGNTTFIDENNIGVPTTLSLNSITYATTKRIKYRDTAWEPSHTVTMGMYVIGKWK